MCFIVVSRVLTLNTKPIEPAVGRRKIIPDFDLVNNLDNNEIDLSCPSLRHHSAQHSAHSRSSTAAASTDGTAAATAAPAMDSGNKPMAETEYQKSFTWNKVVSQNNQNKDPLVSLESVKSFSNRIAVILTILSPKSFVVSSFQSWLNPNIAVLSRGLNRHK